VKSNILASSYETPWEFLLTVSAAMVVLEQDVFWDRVVELKRLEETQFLSEAGAFVHRSGGYSGRNLTSDSVPRGVTTHWRGCQETSPILGLGEVRLRRTKKNKMRTEPCLPAHCSCLSAHTSATRTSNSRAEVCIQRSYRRPKVSEGAGSRFTSSSNFCGKRKSTSIQQSPLPPRSSVSPCWSCRRSFHRQADLNYDLLLISNGSTWRVERVKLWFLERILCWLKFTRVSTHCMCVVKWDDFTGSVC
jgi:hypothetical protein